MTCSSIRVCNGAERLRAVDRDDSGSGIKEALSGRAGHTHACFIKEKHTTHNSSYAAVSQQAEPFVGSAARDDLVKRTLANCLCRAS